MRTTVQIGAQGPGEETGWAPGCSAFLSLPLWSPVVRPAPVPARHCSAKWAAVSWEWPIPAGWSVCLAFCLLAHSLTRCAAQPSSVQLERELVFGRVERYVLSPHPQLLLLESLLPGGHYEGHSTHRSSSPDESFWGPGGFCHLQDLETSEEGPAVHQPSFLGYVPSFLWLKQTIASCESCLLRWPDATLHVHRSQGQPGSVDASHSVF